MANLKDLLVNGVIRCLSKVYAKEFVGKLTGNADSATALTTSAGSSTTPVYFKDGKPVACDVSMNRKLATVNTGGKKTIITTKSVGSIKCIYDYIVIRHFSASSESEDYKGVGILTKQGIMWIVEPSSKLHSMTITNNSDSVIYSITPSTSNLQMVIEYTPYYTTVSYS